MEKSTVTDTRITLGVWDDRVRWTSRQAVSNYIKPGTDLEYLQTGRSWDSTVARPRSVSRPIFSKPIRYGCHCLRNMPESGRISRLPMLLSSDRIHSPSPTVRPQFGATVERGAITLTLEQRAQQSLAQDNAPILVQNQIGLSFSFDQLLGRSGGAREGISWVAPSSAWLNIGQGKVRAPVSQGVAGDTTSDVSFGLAWNVGKIYANVGYWHSDYQSQLYPWNGSGINGPLGFHEGAWAIDLYFDVSSSLRTYGLDALLQPTTQATTGLHIPHAILNLSRIVHQTWERQIQTL